MNQRRLFLLPIEPLEERYTGVWWRWLPETFAKGFDVEVVPGAGLTETVETGAFLDLHSRVSYCASQLMVMAGLFKRGEVKPGDAVFIADLEFFGVEALRYMSKLGGVDVGIYGFLHAASYTDGDFMEPMAHVGQHAELAWIATCDLVFVGSGYHKEAVKARRLGGRAPKLADRIIVTGNPWRTQEARELVNPRTDVRDIDILYPHRPDAEKRPGRFLDALESYAEKYGMPRVAFTTGRSEYRSTNDSASLARIQALAKAYPDKVMVATGLGRQEFYRLLSRTKVVVSAAREENFGYAMVEGMAQGALPLMPACASYLMLARHDHRFLVEDTESPVRKLRNLLVLEGEERKEAEREVVAYVRRHDASESRILNAMLDHGDEEAARRRW
jgi:glycosyltransferase involved in cell wall biosynthesis